MKRIAFIIFFFFIGFFCQAKITTILGVDLKDSENSRLLNNFFEAKYKMDLNKMDSIWNILSQPERAFSQDQLALKNFSYGWFYYFNDIYDESLKYFNETYRIAKQNNQRQLLLNCKASIGNIEYAYKNIEIAIEIFQKVIDESLEEDWRLVANMYGNIAPLQNELAGRVELTAQEVENYYIESDKNYKKSIEILEMHEDWESLARVYSIYSQVAYELGRKNDSKIYLEKATTAAYKSGSKHKYYFNLIKWGEYFAKIGNHQSGIDSLKKANDYFKEVGYKAAYYHSSIVLSNNYGLNQQYDSAHKLLRDMLAYKRRMNVEKMARQSKLYRVELDVYNKENQIKDQARKIELQTLENRVSEANRKRWVIGGISGIAIVILISLIFIQRQKQLAKIERAELIIEEREQAFKSVIDGQEAERKRIAQELHDGIGQQLSGVKMALQNMAGTIKKQEVSFHQQLTSVIGLVGASSSEVRHLAHQMLPQVLEEKGLSDALKDLIQSTFHATKIKFNYDDQLKDIVLNKSAKLTIYRSIQELINNTIKHAEASEIDLYLYESKSNLLVAYSDNGKGMDETTIKSGLGLSGIRHRLENSKGTFTIEPSNKKGFNAMLKLPIS